MFVSQSQVLAYFIMTIGKSVCLILNHSHNWILILIDLYNYILKWVPSGNNN